MTRKPNILFTWELTDGLRCLQLVRPLIKELLRRGCSVAFAARRVPMAYDAIGLPQIPILQAPVYPAHTTPEASRHALQRWLRRAGWGDGDWLPAAADAWRSLIQLFNPTALVLVESPTAQLASRGLPVKRMMVLNSSTVPWPLPTPSRVGIGIQSTNTPEELSNANLALQYLGAPAINSTACLANDVRCYFAPLVPELAPRDQCAPVKWAGPWSDDLGSPNAAHRDKTDWLFVQIRQINLHFALLAAVRQINHPTLVHAPFVTEDMRRHLTSDSFQFVDDDISTRQIATTCRLCITTERDTLVESLHAGTPCLFVPDGNDADPVAARATAIGAAASLPVDQPNHFSGIVRHLLQSESYSASAKAFAARWRHAGSASNAGRVAEDIEMLAG